MPRLTLTLCLLLLTCLSPLAQAERLRLVSDDWAPYLYQENGQPKGLDYEVAEAVFQRLGVEVDWQFLPWKRCLAMVEQGLADGVLDIFQSEARNVFMVFPDEPLSTVEFVLVRKRSQRPPVQRLEDLKGLSVGISPGYNYGSAFNQSPLFRREPGPTHEANFGKLMLDRIDLLVTDRRVSRHLQQRLGLVGQVEEQPLVVSRDQQFLGLVRKPGRDKLARAFADELRHFKQEPAYAALIARHQPPAGHIPEAVEQQESSTPR
ncbi:MULTISPECIES: transporter substrate-binding domain-containing protein [Pseudomonas]|uniref:Polar amino acid transport system substrate-binding protein n=1 Tax=Pseudomonas hunanensis TaxID=1247546 RepID=A0ACC6K2N0_9PSED|nr:MULTISPECIES: transporter substrate-binding domain-containing protein [Pseudomonas]MBP2260097.1 polar amino acid transport system substrate-binding protein [Pseudomonas sp. BP8]MDR6712675.1 polar amino acid transport system substrate-binding protein [Pseudomonas hunanensis]HDS1737163.1 transporter substrate-binding domain-containing protein [Pseudomonas putida]